MKTNYRLLVDGEWLSGNGRQTITVINPANGETIGHLPIANSVDLERAAEAAHHGFRKWRELPALERSLVLRSAAALIRERGEQIAKSITLEQGKPIAQAMIEVRTCAEVFEWYAEEGRRAYGRLIPSRTSGQDFLVVQEPVGPVAAFTPWNFPGSQAARKIAAALSAGCSMVLKGPEEAPGACIALSNALIDAGLPSGVLNLVFGIPAEISSALIASKYIKKISFTGSVPVGKHIAAQASAQMKPVTMELGGHAPVLVFDDCDVGSAARTLLALKFRNAGQVCISPTRFLVQRGVHETFRREFTRLVNGLKVGDGLLSDTDVGPLSSARRLDSIISLVDDAIRKGAQVAAGGTPRSEAGFFFNPTVLCRIPHHARILSEEPFGPIVLLAPFDTVDEAVELANSTDYGLAAYAFTDSSRTKRYMRRLDAGMISLNGGPLGLAETPFGGVKDSGFGREGGSEGLSAYLVSKFISDAD